MHHISSSLHVHMTRRVHDKAMIGVKMGREYSLSTGPYALAPLAKEIPIWFGGEGICKALHILYIDYILE